MILHLPRLVIPDWGFLVDETSDIFWKTLVLAESVYLKVDEDAGFLLSWLQKLRVWGCEETALSRLSNKTSISLPPLKRGTHEGLKLMVKVVADFRVLLVLSITMIFILSSLLGAWGWCRYSSRYCHLEGFQTSQGVRFCRPDSLSFYKQQRGAKTC